MEIYITYLLQILTFSSLFRRFEIKNILRRPTMVGSGHKAFEVKVVSKCITSLENNS